jgi:hypothetical protein
MDWIARSGSGCIIKQDEQSTCAQIFTFLDRQLCRDLIEIRLDVCFGNSDLTIQRDIDVDVLAGESRVMPAFVETRLPLGSARSHPTTLHI